MKFTEEQLQKIHAAKSAEELIELAKAEGIKMSEEEIKAKFAEMHKEGEIADDELDNVAGGIQACNDGRLVVSAFYYCDDWTCSECGIGKRTVNAHSEVYCDNCGHSGSNCLGCIYCSYENALWLCNLDRNRA